MTEVPRPEPAPDGVVVAVHSCGICGSDVHGSRSGWFAPGQILGHELSGTVAAVGRDVRSVKEGQPVTVNPLGGCGSCEACQRSLPFACGRLPNLGINAPGGFSEQVAVPAAQLLVLPDEMALEDGAHVEPLAVALNAVGLARVAPGDDAFVFGVGAIGLNVVLALRATGAGRIVAVGRSAGRREAAGFLGADLVLDSTEDGYDDVLAELGGSFPHAFECSGVLEAVSTCMKVVGIGGTIVQLGLPDEAAPIELRSLVGRGQRLVGSCAFDNESFERALGIVASRPDAVAGLVSERVSLEDAPVAFERLLNPSRTVGVLVQPWRESERSR